MGKSGGNGSKRLRKSEGPALDDVQFGTPKYPRTEENYEEKDYGGGIYAMGVADAQASRPQESPYSQSSHPVQTVDPRDSGFYAQRYPSTSQAYRPDVRAPPSQPTSAPRSLSDEPSPGSSSSHSSSKSHKSGSQHSSSKSHKSGSQHSGSQHSGNPHSGSHHSGSQPPGSRQSGSRHSSPGNSNPRISTPLRNEIASETQAVEEEMKERQKYGGPQQVYGAPPPNFGPPPQGYLPPLGSVFSSSAYPSRESGYGYPAYEPQPGPPPPMPPRASIKPETHRIDPRETQRERENRLQRERLARKLEQNPALRDQKRADERRNYHQRKARARDQN